jgi:hypothetical protein
MLGLDFDVAVYTSFSFLKKGRFFNRPFTPGVQAWF